MWAVQMSIRRNYGVELFDCRSDFVQRFGQTGHELLAFGIQWVYAVPEIPLIVACTSPF